MTAPRLVLASASPRRAELLKAAGISFRLRPSHIDESWRVDEHPVAYTRRIAQEKLNAVQRNDGEVRLSADTTVWLHGDREPLGKPESRARAREMLLALSEAGQHHVTTAFAIDRGDEVAVDAVTSIVHMRELSESELERYLDGQDWSDKAGAYGIQARAAAFIPRVDGSYTNVVGLPVYEVLEALARVGIRPEAEKAT
jgi:septum formation protein